MAEPDHDDATETVRDYYARLRRGDPISPFFASGDDVVKVGISERLVGGAAVAAGLRDQTATTENWRVESHDLRVTERDRHAWFADRVNLAWTDEGGDRHAFDTRWSGTLERRAAEGTVARGAPWRFVEMHVSAARDI